MSRTHTEESRFKSGTALARIAAVAGMLHHSSSVASVLSVTLLRLTPYSAILHNTVRFITKVRLKWVKNRGFDHIIDRDTDIKAASLLIDLIARYPSSAPVPARSLSPLKKTLGLTIPVLRFLRRYPTLFAESPHPRYPSLPSFSLAPAAVILRRRELALYSDDAQAAASRLARLLMMSRSRSLPFLSLSSLRYDLGLPSTFATTLVPSRPDLFRIIPPSEGGGQTRLSLVHLPEDLAVSALQLRHADSISNPSYRDFKRGAFSSATPLTFPMSFPRGYGAQKKVKAWMEDFHRLPYFSPYDDWSGINQESELMEKRVVGVLHEILSLTVHKKTKRNYLRSLRQDLGLPERFTRMFTRYPGIFYLSLKCKTTTVMLREGYQKGKLVDPHPISLLRDKLFYVMRTGILYRGKGMTKVVLDDDLDLLGDDDSGVGAFDGGNTSCDEDNDEDEDGEWVEDGNSDSDSDSVED
ncbi:hypothetical protein HPP92_024008 [Vanilla planifolia]|uniref:PORR domain-containing protein n=1 Tax=Vanilla planifolia TaxID=51239 RepID=A0A835UCJ2_VANPL|nr:hypothetical protein HPP92_024008 [Vanilla planifolia]